MKMKQIKSLQIIGTQRSGSNLLRLMLDQVKEIIAPHPPHILQNFMPLLDVYGDLQTESNFDQLVDDVCLFVKLNPVPWTGVQLERQKVKDRCASPSLVEVFKSVYEEAAEANGAEIWCCKSMANLEYIPQMEKAGFSPIYLHLYRDGRDAALSFKKTIVGEKHFYSIAKKWREDQELCLKYCEQYAADRTIKVAYEELIEDPEKVLRRIFSKLELEYNDDVLNYHQSQDARASAQAGQMWANVAKPVLKDNSKKYLKEATREELEIFEAVAGDMLQKLGYTLSSNSLVQLSKEDIKLYTEENLRLKDAIKSTVSKEDMEKRKPQADLLSAIKTRAAA